MIRSAVLAAVVALAGSVLVGSATAQAEEVRTASLHGTYACSVPPGYTYARLRDNMACGGVPTSVEYLLLDYVRYDLTGTAACEVPAGLTYTASRTNVACPLKGFYNLEFVLADPAKRNLTGTWACGLPSGYTYQAVRTNGECYAPGTGANPKEYLLLRY
ncbi:hypothetical protein GCM10022243_14810 [Saccharothrix violaceirubra]|uniref:Secreted protein n=1 Tax=Saccharothrix violaceirubra TaxID=413306 RepID=A0A7W7WXF8_9PSEU|nr:hypothetical protein [Saccharothrix violaceirubra]MBB4967355.1 hypothetical protein [Saccharothrix violaceirubra]